jgi:hypothetical protein
MYAFHFSKRLASFYALLCDRQIRYNFPSGDLHFFKGPVEAAFFETGKKHLPKKKKAKFKILKMK